MMNSSGGEQLLHNLSKRVSLSRSVVLTPDTSIPSLLILGKLLTVSDGAPRPGMTTTVGSLRAKLLQDWAPSGTVNLWRVTEDGGFQVQFHEAADLRRAMDGAPWSCDDGGHGHALFLMQQAKPEANLVDQLAAGFTTADLWVQFHNVPVEYFSAASLGMLATRVGIPVGFPDLGAAPAPVEVLRARVRVDITRPLVRSLQVDLDDDGRSELLVVSVVYEQVPSLCASCGIIVGHPVGRCPTANARSRSRREIPPAATWSLLLSRSRSRSSSPRKEAQHQQPLPDTEKNNNYSRSSSGSGGSTKSQPPPDDEAPAAASSSSRREKKATGGYVPSRLGSRNEASVEKQPLLGTVDKEENPPYGRSSRSSSSSSEHPVVLGTAQRQHSTDVSVNRCLPIGNILKLISRTKKREPFGVSLQDTQRTNQKQQKLVVTFSAHQNTQESSSLVVEEKETQTTTTSLAVRTPSSIQLSGGYVNYYSCSGSRKNPRIEVRVETLCSAQLMKKAMEWLAENTGLMASYDGKKGVISIVGLRVDERMGPVDLVASLYPGTRTNTGGVTEDQEMKPNSPARFKDTMICLHDENCCKGAPGSRHTAKNGSSR